MSISEKIGFDYFVETPVEDWDSLAYHEYWRNCGLPLEKSTATRSFNKQVEWFLNNGASDEMERAGFLKEQFKLAVGLRLLHGNGLRLRYKPIPFINIIDLQESGRVSRFWEQVMHNTKLDKIEKDASIEIRSFQAQHHFSVANRILAGEKPIPFLNTKFDVKVANTSPKATSSEKVDPTEGLRAYGKSVYENNLKRKRNDDESDYEGLALLFDELSEDALMESIDEKLLEQENKLPRASGNSSSKVQQKIMDANIIEAFHKYENKIPKAHRIFTPAYWGVMDLTRESLFDCKHLTEEDIMQLSQDFADKISWKTIPPEKNVQEYFDNNCEKKMIDNHDIKKLDVNIQFMKSDVHSFQGMMTEEELKMSSTFPLFRGVFNSDKIKNAWGEIQALSTKDARNEGRNPFKKARIGRRVDMKSTLVKTSNKFEVIYGEVAGGLGPFGIPTACRKKRYLDKERMNLIVYGWLQIGLEVNFYAMDWIGAGIYRFGLVDRCRLPSDEDEFGMLEDSYCILKLLENKALEIEKVVKKLLLENIKGKRRQTTSRTKAELNENRTPQQ
ncbi:1155_t:CDS:10 [Funneliformis mosseae]|uniref:1155_t:CDS:1 n=1 Tax=Funneliformis mosseae TaxID=27381 RepID=A0A9N9GBN2_FUNMO|nr:1155_t:CDS:10 [Funneliformis mosseae]